MVFKKRKKKKRREGVASWSLECVDLDTFGSPPLLPNLLPEPVVSFTNHYEWKSHSNGHKYYESKGSSSHPSQQASTGREVGKPEQQTCRAAIRSLVYFATVPTKAARERPKKRVVVET